MPYEIVKEGGKVCVKKKDTGEVKHCYDGENAESKAKAYMRALYAHTNDSEVAEMSLTVVKAAYDKSEPDPNRKRHILMVNSDTKPDLYDERMSLELFKDFTQHIEKNDPIPEQFKSVICEDAWCGGMPYLSIAHYKAGTDGKNVPGMPESVYIDGDKLKSKAFLYDTPLGRKLFDTLCQDLEKYKSGASDYKPTRVSIGFLDMEHTHEVEGKSVTFTRTELGQKCPLCEQALGGKIYKKGYLVHLAATRVPVNEGTQMTIEEKSMGDIFTKKDDAASIVGDDLAQELEQKSLADDILVIKSDETVVNTPIPEPFKECYDPNTDSFNQNCINMKMMKFMVDMQPDMHTVKSQADEVVEDAKRKDVSEADKKEAEKKYGDVKYADETNKKYPIDTKEHVRAALSYWGMPKNRSKYSPEEQKKIGARIHAAAKKFGIETADSKKSDVVEEIMETEEVIKAKQTADDEEDAKDKGDDEAAEGETKKKSALDVQFEALKSLLASGKSVTEVQEAFNQLGKEVEKSIPQPVPTATDIAEIVKSAVESAVAPLRMEIATLKASQGQAQRPVVENPVSRALNIRQQELLQQKSQPTEQLSQIQKLARQSVGLG